MNHLAMITERDDGEVVPADERVWCLMTPYADGDQTFCTGEHFGFGEGGAIARVRSLPRGGITCPRCLEHIRAIKAVKL